MLDYKDAYEHAMYWLRWFAGLSGFLFGLSIQLLYYKRKYYASWREDLALLDRAMDVIHELKAAREADRSKV